MTPSTQPQPLSPVEAWQFMQSNPRTLLIDIRSTMEFLFVGHPVGAIHVPWIDEPDWVINPHFVKEIRKLMLGGRLCEDGQSCAPLILICRSGKRSLAAGRELIKQGFQEIYHVNEGFEGELDAQHHRNSIGGWRFHNLPWEQC